MITLYQRTDCPFCWKVRLALAELDIAYREVATGLGEKHPDVVSLSPTATVPVLVDGDVAIWDSAVIVEYLDSRYGRNRLFTTDPVAQAHIRQLHAYSDKLVGPCLREVVFEKRSKAKADWDVDKISRGQSAWSACMAWLEKRLCHGAGFAVDFSAADCALAARFGVAEAYDEGVTEQFPALFAWYRSVKTRPAWQAAYPHSFIRKD